MRKDSSDLTKTKWVTQLNRLYLRCLWNEGDLDNMRVPITLPDGQRYTFHRRRLDDQGRKVARLLLRKANPSCLRSQGDGGHYWKMLLHPHDSFPGKTDSPTARLSALGLALNIVSIEPYLTEGMCGPVYVATVEDRRARYMFNLGYNRLD